MALRVGQKWLVVMWYVYMLGVVMMGVVGFVRGWGSSCGVWWCVCNLGSSGGGWWCMNAYEIVMV